MNKTDREIDRVLLDVILLDGEQDEAPDLSDMATRAKAILAKRDEERRRKGPAKVVAIGRMKPTRVAKATARRSTREIVEARAGGACEAAFLGGCRGSLHWDHFFGRGKVPPSVELEWMLCEEHDHQKTTNQPNRAFWIWTFYGHALAHDYGDALVRCTKALAIEEAQHPEARAEARKAMR